MSEEPKSFWQRSWHQPRLFFLWLTLFSVLGLFACVVAGTCSGPSNPPVWFQNTATFTVLAMVLGVLLGVLGFILAQLPPGRRWLERVLRRRFLALACVITFLALIVVEEDWRGWHDWNTFQAQAEAQGEKLDWNSAVPAPVPDDQNFAMSPVWAAEMKYQYFKTPAKARQWYGDEIDRPDVTQWVSLLPFSPWHTNDDAYVSATRLGDWRTRRPTDLKIWADYYRHPAPNFPLPADTLSPAAAVLFALGKFDPLLAQLRQDRTRPFSQFPINYQTEPDYMIVLPDLAWAKGASQLVALRTIAELQSGDATQALADEQLLLRLSQATRTEPFLISHLVCLAQFQFALQPLWEGLAAHQWSDAQLSELDQSLAGFDFLAEYEFAMRGERALALAALADSRRTGIWYGMDDNDKNYSSCALLPGAFFYQNELAIARMHQQFLLPLVNTSARAISPAQVKQDQAAAMKALDSFSYYDLFARMVYPALQNSVKQFARGEASLDLARVAVALERYRLAHGTFPETLDALAPQFLPKVPVDVINGQPLHYHRKDDGKFMLYSVGWNEKDDGGTVAYRKHSSTEFNPDQGDWVWQYPD